MKFKRRKSVPHYNRKQINREAKTPSYTQTHTHTEKVPCIKVNINNSRNRHSNILATVIIRNKFKKKFFLKKYKRNLKTNTTPMSLNYK